MGTIIQREGRKGTSYRTQIRRHGRLMRNISGSLSKTFDSYSAARKWLIEIEAFVVVATVEADNEEDAQDLAQMIRQDLDDEY
jgi:hypothetical protein